MNEPFVLAEQRVCVLLVAVLLVSGDGAAGEPTPQLTLKPGQALIEAKEGSVQFSADEGRRWDPCSVPHLLQPGDLIRTGTNSWVIVRLSDLSSARMGALGLAQLRPPPDPDTSVFVTLWRGVTYFFSRDSPAKVRFGSPTTLVAIRGTEFHFEVMEDGASTLTMIEGESEMSAAGERLAVIRGQQARVEAGDIPRRVPSPITAVNVIQWCLDYPAVLDVAELEWTAQDREVPADSLKAYRAGNISLALEKYPTDRLPGSDSERIYLAALLISAGQIQAAEFWLQPWPAVNPRDPDSVLAGALRKLVAAIKGLVDTSSVTAESATSLLAESYYRQSRITLDPDPTGLDQALAAARLATKRSPGFGLAWSRVAELEFSFGRTRRSLAALKRSRDLAGENARAFALEGYLLAAQNRIGPAIEAFERAIQLDAGLGNAWLGRGLCKIRSGQLLEGRRDLEVAVLLEPQRALFRSYLGKAFSETKDNMRALRELTLASTWDKYDPTPWLYAALVHREQNQINPSVDALQSSLDLNENRSLFRSRLLLDQDRAVRGANLAHIYQDAGMTEVAGREAAYAVLADYNNASTHLFLANAYDALRDPTRVELRYEAPWFNELLLANLLSPVGGGPLSQFVSQQEYSRLFEHDGIGGSVFAEWRSDAKVRATTSGFGTYGRTSFGLDVHYWQDDGDRPNADDKRLEIYAQFKQEVSPTDMFYFLGKYQHQESGDTFKTYDNQPTAPNLRFEEDQMPGLLLGGWNHAWGPNANTLFLTGWLSAEQTLSNPRADQLLVQRDTSAMYPGFVQKVGERDQFTDPALRYADPPAVYLGPDATSLVYSPALLEGIAPYLGTGEAESIFGLPFDFFTRRRFGTYSAELQHIQRLEPHTLIAGGRLQFGEFETEARLTQRPDFNYALWGGFSNPASDQDTTVHSTRSDLYLYDFWKLTPWLTLIGGVTWSQLEYPENFRLPPLSDEQTRQDQVSAKAGFTIAPTPWFRLRGVYAQALGGVTFDESVTLEPVQLAGFTQTYRTVISESLVGSVEAPQFTIWSLGLDGTAPSRTWWGVHFNLIEQEVERARGIFTGYDLTVFDLTPAYFPDGMTEALAYREQQLQATLNQLLGDEFSVGARYQVTRSRLAPSWPGIPVALYPGADLEDEAILQEVLLAGNWYSASGFFARTEAHWYFQHLEDDPAGPPRDGDAFWQLHALVGYRFNRNRAEITLGVLNINDADYHLSPLNPYGDIPRERTLLLRVRVLF